MSEPTLTRSRVRELLGQLRDALKAAPPGVTINPLAYLCQLEPSLRLDTPTMTGDVFDALVAEVKRPSGIVPALHDTDPAMRIPTPPPPRESER